MRGSEAFWGTAVVAVSAAVNAAHTASPAGQHVMSLAFGLLYHFLVSGPDNVFTQPPGPWRVAFMVTAVLLSLLQAAGVVAGLRVARGTRQATSKSSKRRAADGFSDAR